MQATTSGTGLLLARDTGKRSNGNRTNQHAPTVSSNREMVSVDQHGVGVDPRKAKMRRNRSDDFDTRRHAYVQPCGTTTIP